MMTFLSLVACRLPLVGCRPEYSPGARTTATNAANVRLQYVVLVHNNIFQIFSRRCSFWFYCAKVRRPRDQPCVYTPSALFPYCKPNSFTPSFRPNAFRPRKRIRLSALSSQTPPPPPSPPPRQSRPLPALGRTVHRGWKRRSRQHRRSAVHVPRAATTATAEATKGEHWGAVDWRL